MDGRTALIYITAGALMQEKTRRRGLISYTRHYLC